MRPTATIAAAGTLPEERRQLVSCTRHIGLGRYAHDLFNCRYPADSALLLTVTRHLHQCNPKLYRLSPNRLPAVNGWCTSMVNAQAIAEVSASAIDYGLLLRSIARRRPSQPQDWYRSYRLAEDWVGCVPARRPAMRVTLTYGKWQTSRATANDPPTETRPVRNIEASNSECGGVFQAPRGAPNGARARFLGCSKRSADHASACDWRRAAALMASAISVIVARLALV
jgi:hypothetical protein